jgi:hypothetical protein
MIRSMLTLSFTFVIGAWAVADPMNPPPKGGEKAAEKAAAKKTKEVMIKELEAEKHTLHEMEKTQLHMLDVRAEEIIKYLDPKEIHRQMEEAARVVRHTHEIISIGAFDYGGNRAASQHSLEAAEHHIHEAIKHNTHVERAKAAEHLLVAHTDVNKALVFSIKKYGLGPVVAIQPKNEPESRAAANRQLYEALPRIEFAHHLLAATDHEIKDWNLEKIQVHKNRDLAKQKLREQTALQIKQIDAQIKALKK